MPAQDPDEHRLRRHLQALPDPVPPASLEARVRASQARRSQLIRGGGLAVAALLFAILAVPRTDHTDHPEPAASMVSAPDATRLKLRAIDRALQNAYARGASDAEVAPLWEARSQLMHDLIPSTDATGGKSS